MPEVSTPGEPLISREREVGVVASLLLPHTPPRTLRPVHETRGASLHMLGEVLWHLVQFGVTSPTEECDPEVLPRMTIGGGRFSFVTPQYGLNAICFHRFLP